MKVLVTGSAGFIGSTLCRKLLLKGHSVIGIDNMATDYDPKLKYLRSEDLMSADNFKFIKLDILNDGLYAAVKNETIDYVVHLAAKDLYYETNPDVTFSDYLQMNIIGTAKAYELAAKLRAKKFIFSSTHSVYGATKKERFTERKILPKPISPHGATKYAAEQILYHLNSLYGVPTIILRIFTTYGPGMRPQTVIPFLIDKIAEGKPIELFADKSSKRDFIYIDDAVGFIMAAFNKRLKFQTLNIASGKSYSLEDLAKKLAQSMGKKPQELMFKKSAKDFSKIIVKNVYADITKAKKLLHYEPKTDIDEGLKKTVDYYLAHPDVLKMSL